MAPCLCLGGLEPAANGGVVADDGHHEIVPFAQQRGAHLKTGSHFVATGLQLAQPQAAMHVRPAKQGGQFAQPAEEISARACRQRGDLSGGAAGLQDSHRRTRT